MVWDIRNKWPDIAEIRTSDAVTDSSFATETTLRLELYTSTHELEVDDYVVTVGFKRLTLQLECDGTEIAVGSRFGDNVAVNKVVQETSKAGSSVKMSASAQASMGFSTTTASLDAKAQAAVEAENSTVRTQETTTQHIARYVTSKPNDKWEIASLDGSALDQKFITHNDELCVISPRPKSNRNSLRIHLIGHKRDIVFDGTSLPKTAFSMFGSGNTNKEKVFKVLAAKMLQGEKEDLNRSASIQLSVIDSHHEE